MQSLSIVKHGSELLKALGELEKTDAIRKVGDRVGLFRITISAMMKACEEFVTLTAEVILQRLFPPFTYSETFAVLAC